MGEWMFPVLCLLLGFWSGWRVQQYRYRRLRAIDKMAQGFKAGMATPPRDWFTLSSKEPI